MITLKKLNSVLSAVQDELIDLGFWDNKLYKIDIYLVPMHWRSSYWNAYGWQEYYAGGEICIPKLTWLKIAKLFLNSPSSLRDVLRHEYAHAFAYTHQDLINSKKFSAAFWGNHDSNTEWVYDKQLFVSEYAATNQMEDFAETFMYYVKRKGKILKRLNSEALKTKWEFLDELAKANKKGLTSF